MARRFFGGRKIRGLSTDTKPTAPEDDAEFYETDTKKTFDWSGSAWVERITGVGSTVEYTELAGDIPLSKLANGTAGKIIGFNASTGAPEEQEMSGGDGAVLLPNDTTIANFTSPISAKGSSNRIYDKQFTQQGSGGGYWFTNTWSAYVVLTTFAQPTDVTAIGGNHRAFQSQSSAEYILKDSNGTELFKKTFTNYSSDSFQTWQQSCNVTGATEFGYKVKCNGNRYDFDTNWTGTQEESRNPQVIKDADDTTYWQSTDEDNPWLHVNMGSTTSTGMIAIKPHTDTNDTVVTIQTGNSSGYPDIEDDFNYSQAEWTKVGTATTVDTGASDKVYIDNIDQNSGDHRVHKNLGITLDDDKWMVDVDLDSWAQTYLTGTPAELFYLSTGTTEPSQTSELHVGVRIWTYSTTGNLQLVASDGSSSTSSSNLSSVGNTTAQYIRIIKDGDTITLKSFSDSARTTGEISQSITATGITGLNTIHFGALCSEQNAFTATMDNLGIWNGVTSVPSADWTTRRTVNVSNLTAGSWNFIRFPAVECKVLRIRGNGTNKTLAITEIRVKNNISATTIAGNHIHKDISTTDTSLGLDGT